MYFRTLIANGSPSTSIAHPGDWQEIFQICFDNREADIGRFLRRQFSSQDREDLIAALRDFVLGAPAASVGPPQPSLREEAITVLQLGEKQFLQAVGKRAMDAKEKAMISGLTWRVALVVQPLWPSRVADVDFLATAFGSNPRYTGWPVWLDARTSAKEENCPKVVSKAWEALIVSTGGWSNHLDFMRLDPAGCFFLRRALQDDLTDNVAPGRALDPLLVIIRVAEAIAVGISITRALLGKDQEARRLGFAFQWTKLAGRILTPWANPMMLMLGEARACDDEVTTFTELSSDTPITSIAPFVGEATRDLFATFQGERIPANVTEDWTSRLVERRLGS